MAPPQNMSRHLRIYYSDFLNSGEDGRKFHSLQVVWKQRQNDLKQLMEWVLQLRPRTKLDAYPMLLMTQEKPLVSHTCTSTLNMK
jgi:hypothetical protein